MSSTAQAAAALVLTLYLLSSYLGHPKWNPLEISLSGARNSQQHQELLPYRQIKKVLDRKGEGVELGFYTDVSDEGIALKLYYEAQYMLAPHRVVRSTDLPYVVARIVGDREAALKLLQGSIAAKGGKAVILVKR